MFDPRKAMICLVFGVAALRGFGVDAQAQSQSLKSIRAQEAEVAALAHEVEFTNSVCGGKMSARIDWKRSARWPDGASLAAACDVALGALEAACRSGAKASASKLTTFVCSGDGSGPAIKGAVFSFGADPAGGGFAEVKQYLDSAL